jgi:hypothetical protein
VKFSADEIANVEPAYAREMVCPYCNAPPGQSCARKFTYPDGFHWSTHSSPPYQQLMWTTFHKDRKVAYLLSEMFIIPEALDLADVLT